MFACSVLPIEPIVARQSMCTRRISPDGMRSVAHSPSFAMSWQKAPAERAMRDFRPG